MKKLILVVVVAAFTAYWFAYRQPSTEVAQLEDDSVSDTASNTPADGFNKLDGTAKPSVSGPGSVTDVGLGEGQNGEERPTTTEEKIAKLIGSLSNETKKLGVDEEEVKALATQILALNPSQPEALKALAILTFENSQNESSPEFLSLLERLEDAAPKSLAARELRWAYDLGTGNVESVKSSALSIIESSPDDKEAFFSLAWAEIKAGNQSHAMRWVNQYRQVHPDEPWMKDLAQQLEASRRNPQHHLAYRHRLPPFQELISRN